MKTIDEIHRDNLALLREEYKGVGKLADKLERTSSQVSQWLNGSLNSKTRKSRGMNDDTCRYIEEKCGKPTGWMDAAHDQELSAAGDSTKVDFDEVLQLITLYRQSTEDGRKQILRMAESAEKAVILRRVTAANE